MRTGPKNGAFKMAHLVTYGPVAYDREYILTSFLLASYIETGKGPETELPSGNGSRANG
jgi:hypothetical protein